MSHSIEKITSVLEDISIKPDVLSDDGFKLSSTSKTPQSSIDDKTIRLLELVDSYEKLTNENRLNYINGFLNLSRANYNTGPLTKKYGPGSFDLRPYGACKNIKFDDEFKIVDLLKKQNHEEQTKTKTADKKNHEIILKNRKTKKTEIETKALDINEITPPKLTDPISQFGGLVPYQLKQSQTFFCESLFISIEIINLQREIKKLIEDIEKSSE